MFLRINLILSFLFISFPGHAFLVADTEIPDLINMDDYSEPLYLVGAGTRSKFIFDIYIGALYLTEKKSNEHSILCSNTPKRIALHFLYDEVGREKLQEGWMDGFVDNNSKPMFDLLKSRLYFSLSRFSAMKKGDVIYFDYLPDIGTRIIINNKLAGVIEGYDFMQAVLKVWIGVSPADQKLKNSMLGNTGQ